MKSIPASQLVNVNPSVLSAGGNPLSLNAVFLDNTGDNAVPVGSILAFTTVADCQTFFGINSVQAQRAGVYFGGFSGANTVPGTLYFAQYNAAAAAAYLRSGSLAGVTLAQLQAFSGTLIVVVDGATVTTPNIDLSAATSFTNAATLIQAGLQAVGAIFAGTGSQAAGVVTIATTVSGHLSIGETLSGAGVEPGSIILSFGTYTVLSGVGTVNVSTTGTVALGAVDVTSGATASYDSQRAAFQINSPTTGVNSAVGYASGTLAADIFLTQATGAVLSLGAAAATPAGVMAFVTNNLQNFATFMTVNEVALGVKEAFEAWVQTTNQRYEYVCQDSDVTALTANASGSFGAITLAAAADGVSVVYDTSGGDLAAFICGAIGSIDFSQTQGRITLAYKGQAGLTAQITDASVANNLIGNGYNFYGAYATANQAFTFLQPGQTAGKWKFIDPYVNQIYLNSQLQLALMELLANVKALPYNNIGYGMIRAACLDPINEALNNGTIQAGVQLSAAQAQEVNTAAGAKIDQTLQNVGWYLQIKPASPEVRAVRGSPPITFWYTDGGSIQKINLASIDVQ